MNLSHVLCSDAASDGNASAPPGSEPSPAASQQEVPTAGQSSRAGSRRGPYQRRSKPTVPDGECSSHGSQSALSYRETLQAYIDITAEDD